MSRIPPSLNRTIGRPPLPAEAKRSRDVALKVRPGDWDDLREIATAWRVHVGEVAFGVVLDFLNGARSRSRREATDLARAAARYLAERSEPHVD